MQFTIKEALGSLPSLVELGKRPIPMRVALSVAHNARAIKAESDKYEKRRKEKVKELGEKDAEGNTNVKTEHLDEFNDFIADMLDEVVEIEVETIPITGFPENFEVESNMLVDIGWMITTT